MTKQTEALKLALEALEWNMDYLPSHGHGTSMASKAITALREALAEQPAQQEPVAGCDSIEAIAVERYKVVPSHDSMFYRHSVVAGNGTQQLYIGREVECENMARKFAGAFLDGAFVMQSRTSSPAQRTWVGLTDEEIWQVWGPVARRMFGAHHLIHTMDVNGIKNESMVLNLSRAIEAKLKEKNT